MEQMSPLLSTHAIPLNVYVTLGRNYSSQDEAHSILIENRNLATQPEYISGTTIIFPNWLEESTKYLSIYLCKAHQLWPWRVSIDRVDPVATGDRSSPFLVPFVVPGSSSSLPVHCFSGSPYKHGGGCTKNGVGAEKCGGGRGRVGPN